MKTLSFAIFDVASMLPTLAPASVVSSNAVADIAEGVDMHTLIASAALPAEQANGAV